MMAPACVNRLQSGLSKAPRSPGFTALPAEAARRRGPGRPAAPGHVHGDEPRTIPGRARSARRSSQANAQPGADTIDFDVAGTIRVGRTSLPAITDTVTIDGSTAPSFAGIAGRDRRLSAGPRGSTSTTGSDGSTLRSLSLVQRRQRGRHAQRLARHGAGQRHRPARRRQDRRRQPRGRRADQRLVARRPDRAGRPGDERQLLQRRLP